MDIIKLFRDTFMYEGGNLRWKVTKGTRAIAGNIAGKVRKDGYKDVGLHKRYYLVHRVIFALHHGYLPAYVDHIDCNPLNNCIENLRAASVTQNNWNARKVNKSTSTDVKGVRKTKQGKFEARIAKNSITYQIGTFSTLQEAASAVQMARESLHCEFSRHG